jgi:hypothetical protein
MPRVGFKPTILASKRGKTVNALDHSATVTGSLLLQQPEIAQFQSFHSPLQNVFYKQRKIYNDFLFKIIIEIQDNT